MNRPVQTIGFDGQTREEVLPTPKEADVLLKTPEPRLAPSTPLIQHHCGVRIHIHQVVDEPEPGEVRRRLVPVKDLVQQLPSLLGILFLHGVDDNLAARRVGGDVGHVHAWRAGYGLGLEGSLEGGGCAAWEAGADDFHAWAQGGALFSLGVVFHETHLGGMSQL